MLGDVDADVVSAAFGFFEPGMIRAAWESVDMPAEKAAAADPAGATLFAGWRALPQATDDPGRALQLIQVLRELRGGLHLIAVRVTPFQAVLTGGSARNSGPDQAREFGWPEPYPEVVPEWQRRWDAAEALTDELIAPAFAVLSQDEGHELTDLLTTAEGLVFGR